MSLLNKMLRDLAATRKNNTRNVTQQKLATSLDFITRRHHNRIKKISIISLIIICVIIFGATQHRPVAPTLPAKVTLNNWLLQKVATKTILDFILSKPTSYYIEHGKDPDKLYITLANTVLTGNFPLAIENSLIQAIATRQNKHDVTIMLTLAPNTKIEEVQLVASKLELILSPIQSTQQIITLPATKPSADTKLQQIMTVLAKGHNHQAIDQLYMFLGDDPHHKPARELLASLLIKQGNLAKAANILELGLQQAPKHLPFIKLQARIYAEDHNLAKAIELLQHNAPNIIDDPNYFALIAAYQQQLGQYFEAAQIYYQLTKIEPDHAAWWLGLGLSLEAAEQQNAAQEAFTRALATSDLTMELKEFLVAKLGLQK